ncbi:MAG TPA: ferredoxin, partial [Ruminiclostridium sp.]|nr:ferredoxin [Ruminiclostridium sp.]
ITIVDFCAVIDTNKCVDCGKCILVCPTGAINKYTGYH